MPHPDHALDLWSVAGRFQQLVYSPTGQIEGLLIDTDGVPTQFVTDPHDAAFRDTLLRLRPGQALVLEGAEQDGPGHEPAAHVVYRLDRIARIDGKDPQPAASSGETVVEGTVLRLNYARHGAPNGVVLDTGDFVHTRPDGFAVLAPAVGDRIRAAGEPRHELVTGGGRVIEARQVERIATAA
ncbi:MAG: hypothetical protein EOO24_00025 [Comamonadaceae bacterium]|nr:MAG: hypothetical protein EOO24_00025 [Comamonadaceae bacterium]